MSEPTETLDVRDEIRRGQDPFVRIMNVVDRLEPGDSLLVVAPFKPVPLLQVMTRKGFTHRAEPVAGTSDWRVLFERLTAAAPVPRPATPPGAAPENGDEARAAVVEVDTRGLEPPQPLVTILEALATLPPGAVLQARTDRRPVHLYDHLAHRGFAGVTMEQPDGSCVTRIHHA